jgi:hypothetical protein
MLVDFLKGNHVAIATATLPWLWVAKVPKNHHKEGLPQLIMSFMVDIFVKHTLRCAKQSEMCLGHGGLRVMGPSNASDGPGRLAAGRQGLAQMV